MAAVAVLLIGAGGFLMYAAYRNVNPLALVKSDILPPLSTPPSKAATGAQTPINPSAPTGHIGG